jgi:predicted DsbA family dithiol-disulfide isomerase
MCRKLLFAYGDHLTVRHLYGGLLPGWTGFADTGAGIYRPADVAPHWAEVAQQYGQPINPSVWLTDPLSSSYPPSIAVHAVRLLDPSREDEFLRRLRIALFLEARNIARRDVLQACAVDIGLDGTEFVAAYESGIAARRFKQELEEVRRLPVRGFPTIIMQGTTESALILHGTQSFQQLEQSLLQVTSLPRATTVPAVEVALAAYKTGTTREFAELLHLDLPTTAQVLTAAGAQPMAATKDELWLDEGGSTTAVSAQ